MRATTEACAAAACGGSGAAQVYTLAQAFFLSKQWRRCLMLLKNTGFIDKDLRFRYLAAK